MSKSSTTSIFLSAIALALCFGSTEARCVSSPSDVEGMMWICDHYGPIHEWKSIVTEPNPNDVIRSDQLDEEQRFGVLKRRNQMRKEIEKKQKLREKQKKTQIVKEVIKGVMLEEDADEEQGAQMIKNKDGSWTVIPMNCWGPVGATAKPFTIFPPKALSSQPLGPKTALLEQEYVKNVVEKVLFEGESEGGFISKPMQKIAFNDDEKDQFTTDQFDQDQFAFINRPVRRGVFEEENDVAFHSKPLSKIVFGEKYRNDLENALRWFDGHQ